MANANPDKIVNKGSIVTLDGTHSTGIIAPSVKKDLPLKFMLTIDNGKGKTATVVINVLVLKDSSKSTHSKR